MRIHLQTFHAAKGLALNLKSHGWDSPAPIPLLAKQNLQSLLELLQSSIETNLDLPPQQLHCTLSTDASDWQWGAHLQLPQQPAITFHGYFNPAFQRKHITQKEAAATQFALHSLQNHPLLPHGTVIRLQVDAQSLYHTLRRMKTRSINLHTHPTQIFALCLHTRD